MYEFEVLNEFQTPYFLGSTFRGILGKRLKKSVCIKPFEDCKKCEFKLSCPYISIFETEYFLNKPSKYVIRPPYEKKYLKEGDKINIEITLLGDTANYWEFITASYSGIINLGKERYVKLKNIYFFHPFERKYYSVKSFVPKFEAKEFFNEKLPKNSLDIKIFPTYIKLQGKNIKYSEFDKNVFIKALITRISNVSKNYGEKNGKIFLDKEKFDFLPKSLKPSPMKRWSNRKKTSMTIPAFEGYVQIKGDLSQIYPYLKIIETINLGKSVSFGLGKVNIL